MEHYLDNAATTKPCAEAAAAVMSCISAHYGNPSSLHRKGLEAQHEVEYARNQIAGALGCKAQEIVFTSGATESSNLAIRGAVAAYGRKRKKIVASAVEHASVKATLSYLETLGFTVVTVPPAADGEYHVEDFLREIDSSVCLVSMMLVNNELGTLLPVAEAAQSIRDAGSPALLHCDAVQAFLDGKTEDDLSKEEAMTRALKRELKRLDQSLSTQWMALEGTRLDDYFAYGPEGGETP